MSVVNYHLDEIDAWRSGQRASPGISATGERYAERMLDAIKRHELALIALGHKPTIAYVTQHGFADGLRGKLERHHATKSRQPSKAAKKANDQIYDLIHNKYFQSIPNDELFAIVKRAGFRFDPEEEEFILVGRDGKATWQLHDEAGREVNHMLVLQWHKLDKTGRFEVVAYVS
jgi:hypothetical protein